MENFSSATVEANDTPADTNSSADPYYIELTPYYVVLNTVYYAVLGPVAVIGNALSVAVSQRILRYRKSIPDMLTGTLAAVDLLCLLSSHTPAVIAMAEGQWMGGIRVCSYQYFMAWSCLKTSFFIIILLTVDRFLALVKPFYYRANVTLRQMKIALFALTLFSFGSTSITIIWFAEAISLLPNWYLCMNTWGKDNEYYSYILSFYGLTFVVGVIIFNVCNTGIVCSLMKHNRKSQQMRLRVLSAAQDRRERRVAKIIETLSVLFMLFWMPYLVFIVLHQTSLFYSEFAEDLAIRILFSNTLLNPVIYGLFNRTYRKAYVYFLRKLLYIALCGKIKKPKERKIFYLRRSYLQHRYARKTHSHGRGTGQGGSTPDPAASGLAPADTNGNSLPDVRDLALANMGFTVSEENLIEEHCDGRTPDECEIYTLSRDVGSLRLNGGSCDLKHPRAAGLENGSGPPHESACAHSGEESTDIATESTWM